MENITLNNGVEIPVIGLGTFRSTDERCYKAVMTAIEEGYRHIDTAMIYGNEVQVGKAVKESGIPREELFITSKLWNEDQGYETTLKAFEDSMERLGLGYLDLYLIHWHNRGYEKAKDTWRAMEALYKAGKIRAIGISNFQIHHMDRLLETAKIIPAINQVECHVELQNHVLQAYCDEKGIQLEAYAPIMSDHVQLILSNDTLIEIGKKYGKTPAQIALKYNTTRSIVSVPKATGLQHIRENIQLFDFELSKDDMKAIRKLNKANRTFPDPDNFDD